jgi:hypothetical protein
MADERRTAPISVRTFPSLKAWLEARALAEGRTLAQYVERALIEHRDRSAQKK